MFQEVDQYIFCPRAVSIWNICGGHVWSVAVALAPLTLLTRV